MPKLLFCSYHCCLDPSSGAALAVRDLLEALSPTGWDCRIFCGPQLDFPSNESIEQLLADQGLRCEVRRREQGAPAFSLLHYRDGGVSAAVYRPDGRPSFPPSQIEGEPFLALVDRVLEKFRPDVVLTYGGQWLAPEIMRRGKRCGAAVVFYLLNFSYRSAELFKAVDAALVPSQFSAEYYRRVLNLNCTAIPLAINWARIQIQTRVDDDLRASPCSARADASLPEYVTFVNPQPAKGLFVFARIAEILGRRRPDIPLLIVESRGTRESLGRTGIDLRRSNLHVMANTPDPRDFYRVSRVVLMPSLWNESFGRVAAEAMVNGIPVLASNRGALPEVVGEDGLLLNIPAYYTPQSRVPPSAEEVTPWVDLILRLWDDDDFLNTHRQRSLSRADQWRPERLADSYNAFFGQIVRR